MNLSTAVMFASQFAYVFLLGFQSRAVNTGQLLFAGLMSLLIGVAQLGVLKLVPKVTGELESVIFLCAGPLAIMSAMLVHARIFRKKTPPPNATVVSLAKDRKAA